MKFIIGSLVRFDFVHENILLFLYQFDLTLSFVVFSSFWIVQGLLVSNMSISARNTVDNLMNLTATYGHMLNGNRIYYQNRSQPPLLTLMVNAIYEFEGENDTYILENTEYLEILKHEYLWWMNTQSITVNEHTLNLYRMKSTEPRPEGYIEEETVVGNLQNQSDHNLKVGADNLNRTSNVYDIEKFTKYRFRSLYSS